MSHAKGIRPPGGYKLCVLCEQPLTSHWLACSCGSQSHPDCLANHFLEVGESSLCKWHGSDS